MHCSLRERSKEKKFSKFKRRSRGTLDNRHNSVYKLSRLFNSRKKFSVSLQKKSILSGQKSRFRTSNKSKNGRSSKNSKNRLLGSERRTSSKVSFKDDKSIRRSSLVMNHSKKNKQKFKSQGRKLSKNIRVISQRSSVNKKIRSTIFFAKSRLQNFKMNLIKKESQKPYLEMGQGNNKEFGFERNEEQPNKYKKNLWNFYNHHSYHGTSLKVNKNDLCEFLSDKCINRIFLIQFANPSIYCYDDFLNSLIYISKFHKKNSMRKNDKQYPQEKSKICSNDDNIESLESNSNHLMINTENRTYNFVSKDKPTYKIIFS